MTFTISNATGEYTDNYAWLYYEDEYREMITSFFEEETGSESVKVYFERGEVNPEIIGLDVKAGEIQFYSSNTIFIRCDYDEREAIELTEKFVDWQKEIGNTGVGSIVIVNSYHDFRSLSAYNYSKYIREGSYDVHITYKIDEMGNSNVNPVIQE